MKELIFSEIKRTLFSAFFLLSVSIVILLYPSASSAVCTWTGAWDITQRASGQEITQRFTLDQSGSQVTGFIDLVGTVSEETVSFPCCFITSNGVCVASGYIIWAMQPDCDHFTGYCEWDYDKMECSFTWSGVRVDAPNQPPEVTLSYYPIHPFVGKLMTFTADAFDPDGDALEYTWYLDGYEYAGTSEFQWPDPTVGSHTVAVMVSDKKGGNEGDLVEFAVIEPKRYVIAPGSQEGSGESWGFVDKIFIDGKEITDFENTVLYSGSQIKTGPGVEILVRSSYGALTRIIEDTQYEVKTTHNPTTVQEIFGRALKGGCEFYWPPGYEAQKKFEVETNRVSVGIKGTTFSVSHFFNVTTVGVEEGVVEVTDLDTKAIYTMQADEALSFGSNCISIADNLSIFFNAAEYDEVSYSFKLDYFPNPDDRFNLYWKMDLSTFKAVMEKDCIPIGGNLTITVPCAEYAGIQYRFALDFAVIPADPAGVYWKMDISTFQTVQRPVPDAQ